MNFKGRGILIALRALALRVSTLGYGPLGHEIVGAIADERLANTPAAAKIVRCSTGLRWERAAVTQTRSKVGQKRVDDPKSFISQHHWKIDRQLRDSGARISDARHEFGCAFAPLVSLH